MKTIKWSTLLIFVLFTELVGIMSSLFAGNIAQVYQVLIKPPLSPPGWIFGIVWIILYALIGTSAYLGYHSGEGKGLQIYALQLLLNFLWPILFFNYKLFWISFLEILLLDVVVLIMIVQYNKINKIASRLLYPYFIWLIFASYLTAGTALLN